MDTFQVHILAADRTFYEGPCVSLTIPTSDGEQGILAHHSPMIAAVQTGTLRWQAPGGEVELAAVSPGMVKVEKNEVLVLVDSAERPEEIDEVRARREADQVSLDALGEGEVLDALRRCQPDTLTPIEAMSLLYELKRKLQ